MKRGEITDISLNAAKTVLEGFIRAHEVVEIAERLKKIEDAIAAR